MLNPPSLPKAKLCVNPSILHPARPRHHGAHHGRHGRLHDGNDGDDERHGPRSEESSDVRRYFCSSGNGHGGALNEILMLELETTSLMQVEETSKIYCRQILQILGRHILSHAERLSNCHDELPDVAENVAELANSIHGRGWPGKGVGSFMIRY